MAKKLTAAEKKGIREMVEQFVDDLENDVVEEDQFPELHQVIKQAIKDLLK